MRRYHHLDVLRSGAMLVAVVWHLTIFWPLFVPLSESTQSVLNWPLALSRFALPLFFLVAGFLGAFLVQRRGVAPFVRHRIVRVGVPLAVGLLTLVPLTKVILHETLSGPRSEPLRAPMHLWFLWYLLLFSAAALVLRRLPPVGGLRPALSRGLGSPFAPLVLALLTVLLLVAGHQLPWPHDPWIVTDPTAVIYYGLFFGLGWLLWDAPGQLEPLGRRPGLHLAVALAALVPAVLLRTGPVWAGPGPLEDSLRSYVWSGASCLIAWSMVFALCGYAERLMTAEGPALRYLTDASYWIYLAHLPLVPVVIVLVTELALPFPVAWALALSLLMASLIPAYALFVRHTAIGRVLHGPRPRRITAAAAAEPAPR